MDNHEALDEQPTKRGRLAKADTPMPRIPVPGWEAGDPLITDNGIELDAKYRIRIAPATNKDEAQTAFVGVNGIGWGLRRGEDLEVPGYVVSAIQQANTKTYRQNPKTREIEEFTENALECSVFGKAS
jgi:hypothetical protein